MGINLPGLAVLLPSALIGMKIIKLMIAIPTDISPFYSVLTGLTLRELIFAGGNLVWGLTNITYVAILRIGGSIIIRRQATVKRRLLSGITELPRNKRNILVTLINGFDTRICIGPYLWTHKLFGGSVKEIQRREKDKDFSLGYVIREIAATGANMVWMLLLTRYILPTVIKTTFVQFGDRLLIEGIGFTKKTENSINYDTISKEKRISAFTELRTKMSTNLQESCDSIIQEFEQPLSAIIPQDLYSEKATSDTTFLDLNNRLQRIKDILTTIPEKEQRQHIDELFSSLPKNIFDFKSEDVKNILELPSSKQLTLPPSFNTKLSFLY